jgi:Allene oxide cyclase barrel like domain
MRKILLAGAGVALALGAAGAVAIPAASQAAPSSPAKSTTLVFDVVFSPFEFVQANPVRNPNSPYSLGDEIVFHDQLFSSGQQVGDEAGSCVVVDVTNLLLNCTEGIRLRDGTITTQFLNAPPPLKQLAITGGTGVYNTAGGDGTLVEFPNNTGKLTLHVLSLVARGGSA